MGRILYFVREALRGFFQAKLMTFVSVVTIAVALLVLCVAALAAFNVWKWLARLDRRADVIVYVDDRVATDSAKFGELCARVREYPQVDSMAVVDKAQAWDRFEAMYGSRMLDMVEGNPLPASLELSLRHGHDDPALARDFTQELTALGGVESVDYSADQMHKLRNLKVSSSAGAAILALLCLAVLYFVVVNTVKLTIYARRDLVINMRFVGATDVFIETPFILEGILQGAIGAAAAAVCLLLFVKPLVERSTIAAWGPHGLLTMLFAIGVLSGWVGSYSAVRKFLD